MKVNVVETKRYESDIKFVDINVISEDEALLYSPRRKIRYILRRHTDNISKRTSSRFYVGAVLTLSDCDLPVGTEYVISKPEGVSKWTVFIKNKAFSMMCFEPDEYTEDEVKLKSMLREWAENNGIKFGE
jgi:hypothetical protein